MTPDDIAISAMPQADGIIKLRPLAVLSEFPRHGDLFVCGITSQMWNLVDGFDVAIRKGERTLKKVD
jgi:mRNA interferase MazF